MSAVVIGSNIGHRRLYVRDCAIGELLHPLTQFGNMNGFGSASLNTTRRRFVEALEKPLACLLAIMGFTNCDAYAIPPSLFPKNVGDRNINIEFGIKVFLRFKSGAGTMCKLIHTLP